MNPWQQGYDPNPSLALPDECSTLASITALVRAICHAAGPQQAGEAGAEYQVGCCLALLLGSLPPSGGSLRAAALLPEADTRLGCSQSTEYIARTPGCKGLFIVTEL